MAESTTSHDPYAALRHADFRLLVFASMLARVGYVMQEVAVGWELYERTHDPLALGFIGLVQVVPVVLLALPAGHAADRYSRKAIVLLTQAALAVCSLGLATISAYRGPVWTVYVCLGVAGTAIAFSNPARWALLPQLVPPKDFANAIAWRTSVWQISSVAGPALGGFALAVGRETNPSPWLRGAAPVFLIDAAAGLVVVALLTGLSPGPRRERAAEPLTLDSLFSGVRFVFGSRLILAAITLDMFAVLFGGATALLPIYAQDILHVEAVGFGWLRAAPSIGAVGMALLLAHRPPLRHAGRALLVSVAGFGLAIVVFGLSKSPALSFVALLMTGALDNISMVVRGTLVQLLTPDEMRGRVSAVNGVFIGMSNQLGEFESGVTARLWGPVAAVVVGGVASVAVVLGVAVGWPEVGRLGRLADVRPHEPEPVSVEGGA